MRSRTTSGIMLGALAGLFLAACGTVPVARVDSHLKNATASAEGSRDKPAIPAPVQQAPLPPPPKPTQNEARYSVTVIDVPVRDILLAMSTDLKINIDIHPDIEGRVTLNAINQTVRQILTRMSRQVDMRWEMDGPNIVVMRDTPYLRTYRVDYVNMSRETEGTFGVQTQVVGPVTAASGGSGGGTGGGVGQNTSSLKVQNTAKNKFWENLERNIKDLLRETDKQLPKGSSETTSRQRESLQAATTQTRAGARTAASGLSSQAVSPGETRGEATTEISESTLTFREAASVIVNPETGTISVRATSRQHEKVAQFIDLVAGAAKRQVLIEATVVEVALDDAYQAGVDWSAVGLQNLGYTFRQQFTRSAGTTPTGADFGNNFFTIGYSNPNAAAGGSISSTVKLLSSFGTTRVLSSPRTTTLNNQTAVMKVVQNRIYFTVKADIVPGPANAQGVASSIIAYTTTPNVVPEGFVMSVTPQIGENDVVTLNIRPSITGVIGYVQDPNPGLPANVPNRIPEIQTREFETVLRVASGQTAVLGGLMQDKFVAQRDGLPILSRVPILGDAVSYRNDAGRKSELVVFIRPIVLKDASLETDLSEYRRYLPDAEFFKDASPGLNPTGKSAPQPSAPERTPVK